MSSLFVLADAGFLQDFFTSDWPRAVAQNLAAAAIAALAARAWYRQRLTDRDLELKAAELGEWYLSFSGDEDAGAALPRAQRFIALAKLLEPENVRWDRSAEELDVATVLDAIKAGRFDGADDGFDDSMLYAISRDPRTARGTIEQCLAKVKEEHDAGHYASAYLIARRAFRLANLALMPNEPLSPRAISELASTLGDLGRFAEAEPLHKRALEAFERLLGAKHPNTLASMGNLAALYWHQGRYGEAEPLYKRVLEAQERVLGAEHPSTLTCVNNLAALYESQGRYDEAEPLMKRALEAQERALGTEHPDTFKSMNNLAVLFERQGTYGEAEPLHKRALEAQERVLGAGHPDTLGSMANLAHLYASQGRYSEAEPFAVRAVQGAEPILGPEHPDTQIFKGVLADIRTGLAVKEGVGA